MIFICFIIEKKTFCIPRTFSISINGWKLIKSYFPDYLGKDLTCAFVDKKTTGSSEVNGVANLQAFQILTHLPTFWEFRINIFEINLLK